MIDGTSVSIDLLGGTAVLGTMAVQVAPAGPSGEIQVGGVDGPILRSLTFGERAEAVANAAASADPTLNLCQAALRLATARPGRAESTSLEILALVLAGADHELPSFVETTLLVARSTGWSADQIARTQAVEIDRLAAFVSEVQTEPAWNTLLLAPGEDEVLGAIRARLATTLLRRGATASSERPSIQPPRLASVAVPHATAQDSLAVSADRLDTTTPLATPAAVRHDASPTSELFTGPGDVSETHTDPGSTPSHHHQHPFVNTDRTGTGLDPRSFDTSEERPRALISAETDGALHRTGAEDFNRHQLAASSLLPELLVPHQSEFQREHLLWPVVAASATAPSLWPGDWQTPDAARTSPAWSRTGRQPRRGQSNVPMRQSDGQASESILRLADGLAALLNAEADLRGLDP